MNRFVNSKFSITLIIIIGLVLRLISLNQSLWLDEATSALVAKMSLNDIFTKFLPGDFHPPLYYLVLKFWVSIFGSFEISLRAPSVIFGTATIYIVYRIAKNYYAPLLVATSGLLTYYSQEARMYSLAALLASWAIYCFVRKKWFWFSVGILMTGMTDYVALFVLPVFWLLGTKNDFKKLMLSHAPLLIFFGLWLSIFISQLNVSAMVSGSVWWQILGVTSFKNIALIPIKFILGRISFDDKILYTLLAAGVVWLFGYLIYKFINSVNVLRRPLRNDPHKVIFGWLCVPIVIGILLSFKIPVLLYYRFLFCLPALYILVAEGVIRSGKYKHIFFGLLLLINILSSFYYLFNPKFQREDWRVLAKTVGDQTIVLPANSQREALIYYQKGNQTVFYNNFDGGPGEIWLSRYVWQIFDPIDVARQKIEKLGYNKRLETNFNGIVFWKYSK